IASAGAAPLPEDVWTAMRDRAAVTVWEGYGLTEASPVVASTLATGRAKPTCIGGPVPGVEVTLRDTADTGPLPEPVVDGDATETEAGPEVEGEEPPAAADAAPVEDGGEHTDGDTDTDTDDEGPGELWIRGPNLFSGYWPDGADGPDA